MGKGYTVLVEVLESVVPYELPRFGERVNELCEREGERGGGGVYGGESGGYGVVHAGS